MRLITVRVIVIAPVMVMAFILIDDVPAAAVLSVRAAAAAAAPTPSVKTTRTIMVRNYTYFMSKIKQIIRCNSDFFSKATFAAFVPLPGIRFIHATPE